MKNQLSHDDKLKLMVDELTLDLKSGDLTDLMIVKRVKGACSITRQMNELHPISWLGVLAREAHLLQTEMDLGKDYRSDRDSPTPAPKKAKKEVKSL